MGSNRSINDLAIPVPEDPLSDDTPDEEQSKAGTIAAGEVISHISSITLNRAETCEINLKDKARAGDVVALGRKISTHAIPIDTNTVEPIPKEAWGYMKINIAMTLPPLPSNTTTYLEGHSDGPLYHAVRFIKKEIFSFWPLEKT